MLGIQNQPQLSKVVSSPVSFNGKSRQEYSFDDDYDEFEYADVEPKSVTKEEIEKERDKKINDVKDVQKGWEDFAKELEESDNKAMSKMGKGARLVASAVGLAGTFLVAKYSSKLTIETLKSFAKSKTMKGTLDSVKGAKKPFEKAWNSITKFTGEMLEKPVIKSKIDMVKNSKVVKGTQEFFQKESVKKLTEPIKNTLKSVKDIKINGEKTQAVVENTMAGVTTGSVLVDHLTGRNDDKSVVELATGGIV